MVPSRLLVETTCLRLLAVSLLFLVAMGATQPRAHPRTTKEKGFRGSSLVAVEVRVREGARRRLGEVEPIKIRGPRSKVPNCRQCKQQRIPDMCGYQPGTEPPGARWEDYQREANAGLTAARGTTHAGNAPQRTDAAGDGGKSAETAVPVSNWRHRTQQKWQVAGAEVGGSQGNRHRHRRTATNLVVRMKLRKQRRAGMEKEEWRGNEPLEQRSARPRSEASFMSSIIRAMEPMAGRGEGRQRHLLARIPPQRQFVPPSAQTAYSALRILDSWKRNPNRCGMWTRSCVRRYLNDGETLGLANAHSREREDDPLRKLFRKQDFKDGSSTFLSLFPDLSPGDFGSCAVVAVGDNLLRQGRGGEIDAHDTVLRYNAPIKHYVRDVGVKSNIMYWKVRTRETEYGREGQAASQFYVWKDQSKYWEFGQKAEWANNTFRGKPILWSSGASSQLWEGVYKSYRQERGNSRRGGVQVATGGFRFALDVLASGLCKRVDLYGFTAQGSGKYFSKRATMKPAHNAGLEHWVFREAQAMGLLCVYD